MKAVKKIAKRLKSSTIDQESAAIFEDLILALHTRGEFQLARLYDLNYEDFELALLMLAEWRLQRYYMAEGGLLGLMKDAGNPQDIASFNH